MMQKLTYEEAEQFTISSISVAGEFNKWDARANYMKKNSEGIWEAEIDFPVGQSLYKLVFNDEMTMNDPSANLYMPNESGELMSVMIVDEESGKRLYNNEQYSLDLSSYCLNSYISKKSDTLVRSYFLDTDRKAVLGLGFKNITGIHAATVAWYSPDGVLRRFSEGNLFQPDGEEEAKLWFWLELEPDMPKGQWQLQVFIDGLFVLSDTIGISEKRMEAANNAILLPIGSVVLLKDTSKRVMIYGRGQRSLESEKIWDYAGCLYPEGNIGPDHTFLFDHEQIERVDHQGLRDQEEAVFLEEMTKALKA